MKTNPLRPFLEQQGFCLLDGGMGSALEQLGANVNTKLWASQYVRLPVLAIADDDIHL